MPEVIPCSSGYPQWAWSRRVSTPPPIAFRFHADLCVLVDWFRRKASIWRWRLLRWVLLALPARPFSVRWRRPSKRDKLKQQTVELGLSDCVEFVGGVPPEKVADLIAQSTLVLIPSRLEGFGLVALEAGAMARPVVATRVGGLPEVIVHEETGLLVNQESSPALADAIALLLDHTDVAMQMGQAVRRRVEEVFSWERCVDAYDTVYQKLAATKHEAIGF